MTGSCAMTAEEAERTPIPPNHKRVKLLPGLRNAGKYVDIWVDPDPQWVDGKYVGEETDIGIGLFPPWLD